ncbi:MAG: RNA pseudouridine synthase [Pseudomonadota bacterium]
MSELPSLPIVWQNNFFVAINRPPGMLSVPSRMGKADPRPCAGIILQEQLKERLFPTHRLDEVAGGLLLFAKNADAHRYANNLFEKRLIHKEYQAITFYPANETRKIILGQKLEWKSRLSRGKKRAYLDPRGKDCLTTAIPIQQKGHFLKWLLHPATGRPHQLRFELFHRGYPILGDSLYGSEHPWPAGGIALRLCQLGFPEGPERDRWELPAELIISGIDFVQ